MIKRLGLLLLVGLLAACGGGAGPTPTLAPSPSPSTPPTPSPTNSPSLPPAADFYLRAWISQSLPPRETFTWAPMMTVADGLLLDGNVAVPAIYPGPLMISPIARTISEDGIDALIAEAEALGLLGEQTDFTGGELAPGAPVSQIELIVDAQSRTLVGNSSLAVQCSTDGRCTADPGTPEAFAAFWQELMQAQVLLDGALGPVQDYQPERVALLLTEPPAGEPGLSPVPVEWPLDTPLAETGVEFPGEEGTRCVTLEGEDLEAVLPILQNGNALTTVFDQDDTQAGLLVRVLVPNEPSPCPDAE
jgi:hypothetical protein